MTVVSGGGPGIGEVVGLARPGSRAARLRMPLAPDALRSVAERAGVCTNLLPLKFIDRVTGRLEVVDVACGARLASKCKVCAERVRRDRVAQFVEGWHLEAEPVIEADRPTEEALAMVKTRCHLEAAKSEAERESDWVQVADVEEAIAVIDGELATANLRGTLTPKGRDAKPRKTRSTKRRQDAPDLPRLKVEDRTLGRTFATRKGTVRPSMMITLTLGSYGDVHTAARPRRGAGMRACPCGVFHSERDPMLGVPLDPNSYDYRRAALDSIHFARVLDRWWQNLRRAVGWNLQYAGCVELQKRLAPHAHFAIRGTVPRKLLRQVAAATYHQVWWPRFDRAVYTVDGPPVWDKTSESYVDPKTGEPLTTWDKALEALDGNPDDGNPDGNGDEDAVAPAYVARLGMIDPRGVTGGTKDAQRSVRYITKYLTKDITEHVQPRAGEARAHFDRMHQELSTLPCSPTCANWLLYGVQPDKAKAGLVPGRCSGKVHQRKSLGFTGRRCLVSRRWSIKTLSDHQGDRQAWVRAILAGNFADNPDGDQAGDVQTDDERGPIMEGDGDRRYFFEIGRSGEPGIPPLEYRIMRAISAKLNLREAIDEARRRQRAAESVNGVDPPGVSATTVRSAA